MIILKMIFKKCDGDMDWVNVAQDMERWRALVECGNEPMSSMKCGKFLD